LRFSLGLDWNIVGTSRRPVFGDVVYAKLLHAQLLYKGVDFPEVSEHIHDLQQKFSTVDSEYF
jgi:hypothetical protein